MMDTTELVVVLCVVSIAFGVGAYVSKHADWSFIPGISSPSTATPTLPPGTYVLTPTPTYVTLAPTDVTTRPTKKPGTSTKAPRSFQRR